MRAGIVFLSILLWTLAASPTRAQISYYQAGLSAYDASSSPASHNRSGYAKLDWSNANDVRGELCLMSDKDAPAIKVPLQGTNPETGVLLLKFPRVAGFTFPTQPIKLKHDGSSSLFESWDNKLQVKPWTYGFYSDADDKSVDKSISFSLTRIPNDLKSFNYSIPGDDTAYRLMHDGLERPGPYKLSNYDSLTKEQVIALESKHSPYVSDGGYDPGIVLAVIPPSRLPELHQFLANEGGGADFEDPSDGACGAPYVSLEISVPPLLEFYYARKIQRSGLVVTAYPRVLGAGPGFESFRTENKPLAELLRASDIPMEKKDQQLWSATIQNIRRFVDARRPDFKDGGTISRLQRGGGQFLAYRLEIVGPALSECTRNRWEKLLLQVIPQGITAGAVDLIFQFQEGFFAPGSPDRRPDDARIRENRIPDGALEELQQRLGGFLTTHGFASPDILPDDNPPATQEINCKL